MHPLHTLLNSQPVQWKTLGEVCAIKTGQAVSKKIISDNEGIYPVINSGREPLGYINQWNTDNDPIGITTRGAGVGSITWQEGKYFRGNLNYAVSVKDQTSLNVRFLFYVLSLFQPQIHSLCTFAGIPALNASELKTLEIPLPPLPLQARIVEILDQFTACNEQLTAALNKEHTLRKKQYAHYRDLLLSEAELSKVGFEWKALGEVCLITDGDHQSPPKAESGIPFVTISNIKQNQIDFSQTKYVPESYFEQLSPERVPQKGDILYTVVGTLGMPVRLLENDEFAIQRHIAMLRPRETLLQSYLYHLLQTTSFFDNACAAATGAAQRTIGLRYLRGVKIPLPPLPHQQKIVEILDRFDTLTHSITQGIPREIELRRKQYEYYRDLLLTFD